MKISSRFILIVFVLIPASIARAESLHEITISEALFQKGINLFAKNGKIPLEFGSENPDSEMKLKCLTPQIRFPRKGIDQDLTPRLMIHLFCSFDSKKYKIHLPCPYQNISEVPESEFSNESQGQCSHLQASIQPTVENGTIALAGLALERLALFPVSFSKEIHDAFIPLEKEILRNLNLSFQRFGNPWFQSLMMVPVSFTPAPMPLPAPATGKIRSQAQLKKLEIDLNERKMRLTLSSTLTVVPGGSP